MAFLLSSGGGDDAWCMQVFIRLRNPSYILLEGVVVVITISFFADLLIVRRTFFLLSSDRRCIADRFFDTTQEANVLHC
jgi:hypothetical protein